MSRAHWSLQIRYASKRHYQTIETSATGPEGLAWGLKQCLVPYGVAGARIVAPDGAIVVRATRKKGVRMIVKLDPNFGLRALTVKQPYASQIASGQKTIEYRGWASDYRGDLLITASANPKTHGPYGVTVCIVELWDDLREHKGCEWYLRNPRPVKQVAVTGYQGLWIVKPALAAKLGLEIDPR
jgi:ASCH domain